MLKLCSVSSGMLHSCPSGLQPPRCPYNKSFLHKLAKAGFCCLFLNTPYSRAAWIILKDCWCSCCEETVFPALPLCITLVSSYENVKEGSTIMIQSSKDENTEVLGPGQETCIKTTLAVTGQSEFGPRPSGSSIRFLNYHINLFPARPLQIELYCEKKKKKVKCI